MKILLIHQYFLEKDDGGGSRFNEFTRIWEEQQTTCTVLAGMVHYVTGKKRKKYRGKYTYVEDYSPGIRVIRSNVSEAYNVNFLGRLWGYVSFTVSSLYAGLFKARGKYDLILATSPPLFVGLSAYLLSRLKRTPYVFEIRDLWPESAIDTGVLRNGMAIRLAFWLENFLYKRAVKINVLTPAFERSLIEKKKVPAEKILYIPNGSDFTLSDEILEKCSREALREQYGFGESKVVIYVGAHGVANDLMQIIDAAEFIHNHGDMIFLLVGDGMQKSMIMNEATSRELTNVRFVDPVPKSEVFKYIYASDFGISILKKADTFKTIYSNKTFDYMSCKRPIIMAIDGISRELVEEAKCGVYVEPGNPKRLAQVVLEYCNKTQDEVEKMGNAGYEYAKEHFDRFNLGKKYLQDLRECINE